MSELDDLPDQPDPRQASVPGTHLVTGEFQPRPPNANSPGPRYNDGPVERMLALRNGTKTWRPIPDPNRVPRPTEEPDHA